MKKLLVLGMLLVGTISQAQEFFIKPFNETIKFSYVHVGMGGGDYRTSKYYNLTGYSKFDFDISSGFIYFKMSSGNYGATNLPEINEKFNWFKNTGYHEVDSYHFGLNIPLTKYLTFTPMVGNLKVTSVYEGHSTSYKTKSNSILDVGYKLTAYPFVSKNDKFSVGVHVINTTYEDISFGATFRVKWSALSF